MKISVLLYVLMERERIHKIKQEELSRMTRGKEAVVTFSEKFNKLYREANTLLLV